MNKSTWSAQPATGEWNTATNWDPTDVPADTASFAKSSQTAITFSPSSAATVNNIEFADSAPSYTFMFGTSPTTPALTIAGQGIANDSTSTQSFKVASKGDHYQDPQLKFEVLPKIRTGC